MEAAKPSLWTGRTDSDDNRKSFRYHQIVETTPPKTSFSTAPTIGIIGFSCEEGVRRNKGRLGAAHAPDALRGELAKLPWRSKESVHLWDTGTVICEDSALETAQQQLGKQVTTLLQKGITPIILGGGHETAYGHYLGVRQHLGPEANIGIVNIDAHFDLRPYDEQTSSGTMFKQILDADSNAHYYVVGIQRYGNTDDLFDRANALGVHYVLEEDMNSEQWPALEQALHSFMDQQDAILLTLCTDVLSAAVAPGVSAPSPFGLQPHAVRSLIRTVVAHPSTLSFDISEVNPLLDEQQRTVKLGAYLVNEAIATFCDRFDA